MCWILLQETDWLTGYFCTTRQCYSQRFEDVYKTSTINVAEAYFLPSNWVFNIITLKIKLLSPNSWFNPNLRGFLGVRFKVWMREGAKSSFKIIHKSGASYLCCYCKRSYIQSIERSFRNSIFVPKIF